MKIKKAVNRLMAALICAALTVGMGACSSSPASSGSAEGSSGAQSSDTKSPDSKGGKTLTFLISIGNYEGQYDGAFEEVLKSYNENGNKIDFQVIPQFYEAMKVKLSTGDAPDMWMQNLPTDVGTFGEENCAVLDDEAWVSRLSNPDICKWTDGHLYGFPLRAAQWYPGMYYNKSIYEQAGVADPAPKTMAEFWQILDTVKEKAPDVATIGMANNEAGFAQYFVTICGGLAMQDTSVWDKLYTNQMKYAEVPELVNVMADFKKLVDTYANKDHISTTRDTVISMMATEKAATIIADESVAVSILGKNPDIDLGVYPIPYGDQDLGVTGSFVESIYLNAKSENLQECKDFINWFAIQDHLGKWYQEQPAFSSLKDVENGTYPECVQDLYNNYIATGKYVKEMNSYMSDTKPLFDTYLVKLYQEVLVGQETPESMWQKWDNYVADYMKETGNPDWA